MLEACGSWLPYILGALFVGFLTAWWMWGGNKTMPAADHSRHGHAGNDHAPPEKEAPVAAKSAANGDPAKMALATGAIAAAAGTAAVAAKAKPKAKTAPAKSLVAPKPAPATVKKAPAKVIAPAKAATPKAKVATVKSVAVKPAPVKPVAVKPVAIKADPAKVVAAKAPKAKPVAALTAIKVTPKPAAKTPVKVAPKPTAKATAAKAPATKPIAANVAAKPKPKSVAKPKIVIPDNLELLKGVGPKLNALLKSMGVTSFVQVANWKPSDIREIDSKLGNFAGRISRDNWVDQAKLLLKSDVKGFEKKYGTLGSEINRG